MSDTMLVQTKNGIRWIHTRLLAVTEDLPEELPRVLRRTAG